MSLFIETLENRQFFNAGAVDPTFGTAGETTIAFRTTIKGDTATPTQVAVDQGGRTYVLGRLASAVDNNQVLVQIYRLTREGLLDPSFNEPGRGFLGLSISSSRVKGSDPGDGRIAIDGSNRLLVLMWDRVYRFLPTGRLDPTFGKSGVAMLSSVAGARDMAVDATGNIWLAASSTVTAQGKSTLAMSLVKLASNGRFDTTFDGDGVLVAALPGPADATNQRAKSEELRLLPDGSIVVAGSATYQVTENDVLAATGIQSMRVTPAGVLDGSYGTNGLFTSVQTSVVGGSYIVRRNLSGIRGDGTIVFDDFAGDDGDSSAWSYRNFTITAAGANGPLVEYDGNDRETLGRSQFIRQADGAEIIVRQNSPFGLLRVTAAGQIDSTFNGGTAIKDSIWGPRAAAMSPDGSIVFASVSSNRRTAVDVQRIFRSDAPAAEVYAKPLTQPASSIRFSVIYRDPDGIDPSSITGIELRVVNDSGDARRPRLVEVVQLDAYRVMATYKVANPVGNGMWNKSDNGAYAVRVLAGYVKDNDGHAMTKRTLGELSVAIP